MLTATGFVYGRGQILTPTESTSLDRSPTNWLPVITSATPYGCAKFGVNPSMGFLGEWVHHTGKTQIGTGKIRRRIFTLDGSNDTDSRKSVPFCIVDIVPILRVKYPQKAIIWKLSIFCAFGLKTPIHPQNWGHWGFHILPTIQPSCVRNRGRVWPLNEMLKRGYKQINTICNIPLISYDVQWTDVHQIIKHTGDTFLAIAWKCRFCKTGKGGGQNLLFVIDKPSRR